MEEFRAGDEDDNDNDEDNEDADSSETEQKAKRGQIKHQGWRKCLILADCI